MIYLDNFATTAVDPAVQETLNDVMKNCYANPHSVSHSLGWEVSDIIDDARQQLAKIVGGRAGNVIFTSGATEANNMALRCINPVLGRNIILISAIEHACVIESAKSMQSLGYTVKTIPVNSDGRIDMRCLDELLDDSVLLVSVMLVNNEIGTVQDIALIAEKVHYIGALLHSDCAQAVGKVAINMTDMGIDLISLSGHKMYASKGIGALVISNGVNIGPLILGGGQEKGYRSGTLPTPLIAGFGKACEIAELQMDIDNARIKNLRDKMEEILLDKIIDSVVLGCKNNRIAGALNLYIPNINTDSFFTSLNGVAVSSGSACTSAGKEASIVMQAIGIDASNEALSLRISVGRFNTQEEIKDACKFIILAYEKVNSL